MNNISNNKKFTTIFIFTIICLTLAFLFLMYFNNNYSELFGDSDAVNGYLDTKNTTLSKDGYSYIDGEWNFYANKLLISENYKGKADGTTLIPSKKSIPQPSNLNCASYSLNVSNLTPGLEYYLNLSGQPGDYNIFVDGESVLCGKHHPGVHTSGFIPENPTINIVIEVYNFSYNGIYTCPMLSLYESYNTLQNSRIIIDAFLYGAFLFFLVVYVIVVFLMKRPEETKIITFFILISSLYLILDIFLRLNVEFATYSYSHPTLFNNIKVTIYGIFTFITLYVCCHYFNNKKVKKAEKIILGSVITGWIISLVSNLNNIYIVLCYLVLFYCILKCIKAIYKNVLGANQYSYAILCVIFGILFNSIKTSTKFIVDTAVLFPICLIAAVCFILIRFTRINNDIYTKKLIEKYKEAERENALLSLQVSRVKPHFIYNTLGTIQYLCRHDSKVAEEVLISFAKYLRHNIDIEDSNTLVHFTEELEHIGNYITIINHRYQGKINVIYNLGEKDFFIPPLSIATVVENAVKHGASKLEDGGEIIISTYKKNGNYVIHISNDGIPYNGQPMGVGLTSCIERIKNLQNGIFSINPRSTNGTVVIIEIPMEEN